MLPVFAPVLIGIDFGPHLGEGGVIVFLTWFIILMSVKLQTSFLTPQSGFTLFFFCMKGTRIRGQRSGSAPEFFYMELGATFRRTG